MSDHTSPPAIRDALLIFVKYPEPGRVKTRLAAGIGDGPAADAYRRMAEHTLREALALEDAALYVFYDPPEREDEVAEWLAPLGGRFALAAQMDGDLGARMSAAFRRIFSRNTTQKVVVVGTDCPELDAQRIREAFAALDASPVVVGPAADGGYYLLGMRRFFPTLFEGIPWSTGGVLAETCRKAREQGVDVNLLGELRDVDTPEDLGTPGD